MKNLVLESAKGVKGGKVQLTFSQMVELPNASNNILGLLNASDERFNQPKARYAYLSGQPEDIEKQFGINVSALTEGAEMQIGLVDPTINGKSLNIQIVETTQGTEWEVANFEKSAKRAGKDGDFILHNGMYIYMRATVVLGEPKHQIFTETTRSKVSGDDIKSAINEAF